MILQRVLSSTLSLAFILCLLAPLISRAQEGHETACNINVDDLAHMKDLAACQLSRKIEDCEGLGFDVYQTPDQLSSINSPGALHKTHLALEKHEGQALVGKEQLKMKFLNSEILEKREKLDANLKAGYKTLYNELFGPTKELTAAHAEQVAKDMYYAKNPQSLNLSALTTTDPNVRKLLDSFMMKEHNKIFKPHMQKLLNTLATQYPSEYQKLLLQFPEPQDSAFKTLLGKVGRTLESLKSDFPADKLETRSLQEIRGELNARLTQELGFGAKPSPEELQFMKTFMLSNLRAASADGVDDASAEALSKVLPFLAKSDSKLLKTLGAAKYLPRVMGSMEFGAALWILIPTTPADDTEVGQYIESKKPPREASLKEFNKLIAPCTPDPDGGQRQFTKECRSLINTPAICARLNQLKSNSQKSEIKIVSQSIKCTNSGSAQIDATDSHNQFYHFDIGADANGRTKKITEIAIKTQQSYGLTDYSKYTFEDGQFSVDPNRPDVPVTLVSAGVTMAGCCTDTDHGKQSQCLAAFNSHGTDGVNAPSTGQ